MSKAVAETGVSHLNLARTVLLCAERAARFGLAVWLIHSLFSLYDAAAVGLTAGCLFRFGVA